MRRKTGFMLAACALLAACDGKVLPPPKFGGISSRESKPGTGLKPDPVQFRQGRNAAVRQFALSVAPPQYDISQFNPPVGDQGSLGSCVSWSEGWGLMGWQARKRGDAATRFAPMYLYSQFCTGIPTCGSSLYQPLQILVQQGIAEWDLYNATVPAAPGMDPAAAYNYVSVATDFHPLLSNAALHRAASPLYLFGGASILTGTGCPGTPGAGQVIRDTISQGIPVVIGLPVGAEFDAYNAGSPPVPALRPDEGFRGYHAVLATRYDENGLWIQNQWGTGWGRAGWAELSWDFIEQCNAGVIAASGLADPTPLVLSSNVTLPLPETTISGLSVILIQATPGDSPLAQVLVSLDGQPVGAATREGPFNYRYPLNTVPIADGAHSLTATVIDTNGASVTSASIPVTIQNDVAKDGIITFYTPAESAWVRGAINVTLSATSPREGVAAIGLTVDDGVQATQPVAPGTMTATFGLDTTQLADGAHTLRGYALGRQGALASTSRRIFTDNTPPIVSIVQPIGGATLSGVSEILVNASDPVPGTPNGGRVTSVLLYANDFQVGSAEAQPGQTTFTLSWDTTALADGSYALSARATDALGNLGVSATVQVSVSNRTESAVVSIVSPTANATVSGDVAITTRYEDVVQVVQMDLLIDAQLMNTKSAGPNGFAWDWATGALPDGLHTLQVVAHDARGRTFASEVVNVTTHNAGQGLSAEYFDDPGLGHRVATRTDPELNFDWGWGSPGNGIPADRFSARWTGQVVAPSTGTYTLSTVSDDGIRVWLNGELIIDNWTDHAATENTATVQLQADAAVPLRVEFYENGGLATAELLWQGPGIAKQIIPRTALRQDANVPLVVAAYGTPVAGQYPVMQVSLGGTLLASWTVTGELRSYVVQVPANYAVSGAVRVAFVNDAYSPPEDRNLYVESVTVNGRTHRADAPDVYSQSCARGLLQTSWLYCEGYFDFPM